MSDLFLRACRKESVERTPLWIMRQAGRYLPEYRALRERNDFLTVCRTPELATEVTLQPIRRFGFDAAILFSDIMVVAEPMGFEVSFDPGPQIAEPVRSVDDLQRVRGEGVVEQLGFVYETIGMLRNELDGQAPLIGFAASPFTLAVYLVEGGGSKNFSRIKALLYEEPETAHGLLDKVTRATADHLAAQIEAGVQAIQLFDTWAGLLAPPDYREFALRYAVRVLEELEQRGVPRIYFALNAAHLLREIAECRADVVGVDWRTPLDQAASALGRPYVLQGNLDPCALFASPERIQAEVKRVLRTARELPGHVFNLGHGILPGTPVEHVEALVEAVRNQSRRG